MPEVTLKTDLQRLLRDTGEQQQALPPKTAPGAIPERLSVRNPSAKAPSVGGGGGIASPITEDDYTKRTWHDTVTTVSPDGILTYRRKPLATLTAADANGNQVEFVFAKPSNP